jgi:CO/xanthine dehydrogenase FAD-binding subunit
MPINTYSFLLLVFFIGSNYCKRYPGEISVQLRMAESEVSASRIEDGNESSIIIFFREPGYYQNRVNDLVVERIPIPETTPGSSRQFSFIISDRYGDGR